MFIAEVTPGAFDAIIAKTSGSVSNEDLADIYVGGIREARPQHFISIDDRWMFLESWKLQAVLSSIIAVVEA